MSAQAWFEKAIEQPRSCHFVEIEGATIAYDHWAGPSKSAPALLFVHGNAAHRHWWDFIAPAFTSKFNVLAMDMSGSGDSDHREVYSVTTFANEIAEVCRQTDFESYIALGHSFGGSMTRIAAHLHPEVFKAIVLIDSGVSSAKNTRMPPRRPRTHERYFETMADAKLRFRLRPPQPCDNDYILDYIAAHSVEKTDKGFRFKVDQALFGKMDATEAVDLPDGVTMLKSLRCPVGFVYGTKSRFFPEENVALLSTLIRPELLKAVIGAHHHVFLDQPLAFIEAVSAILSQILEA